MPCKYESDVAIITEKPKEEIIHPTQKKQVMYIIENEYYDSENIENNILVPNAASLTNTTEVNKADAIKTLENKVTKENTDLPVLKNDKIDTNPIIPNTSIEVEKNHQQEQIKQKNDTQQDKTKDTAPTNIKNSSIASKNNSENEYDDSNENSEYAELDKGFETESVYADSSINLKIKK